MNSSYIIEYMYHSMYLEILQDLCLSYERADPATRAKDLDRECWKCCVSHEPQLLRLGGHWLHRCLVAFLPQTFRISVHLYESQKVVWDYLARLFGKTMIIKSTEVDVGDQDSNIRPGGFLLTTVEFEDPEWMHMVSVGSLHLWRKRFLLPWP